MFANKFMPVVVLVALVFAVAVFAAVPTTINYQGYLKNTDGTPVSTTTSVRFSLYSSNPPRNNPLWQETQSVTPNNGIYSTQLGSVTPISASFDVPYWLGVKVAGDAEMALQALSSVPYAKRTAVADTLSDSATLGGQAIVDLDLRYATPSAPNPTLQQIATPRWDQVRAGDLTSNVGNAPSALVFDGRNIWVANNASNNVMKINPATGAILGTFGVGSGPFALAFDGTNIWVANYDSNNVMKLNPATGAVIGTCTVGTNPIALAFDGANIWVANFNSNNIMKVNPATSTVIGTYSGGTNPRALTFDGTYIWVASQTNNNVMKFNLWGSTIGTYPVGTNPAALAFDGASVWAANLAGNNVTKLNPSSGAVIGTYSVGNNPYALFFDGTSMWVANRVSGSIMKLNPTTGAITGTYTVGNYPYSLAFDGASIWVANYTSNTIMKLANAGIQVGDQVVGTAQLADSSVTSAKISGTISAAKLDLSGKVSKSGDTMSGTLNLPANGLVVGANQLVLAGGNVGIGTATANDQLELTGNLRLPTTSATAGIIKLGSTTLIHSYGDRNFFAGKGAGNLSMSGNFNTATGYNSLSSNTSGTQNTASGSYALQFNTTGNQNTANGSGALIINSSGSCNTASGAATLGNNSTGSNNTADGCAALNSNSLGFDNVAIGAYALNLNTTGGGNTAIGSNSLGSQSFGNGGTIWSSNNTAVGSYALFSNHPSLSSNGINNTAVGYRAGYTTNAANANTTGYNNTFIGTNSGPGTATQLYNATAIGYNAQVSQNNSLVLGGTGADAVNVGIGTTTPSQKLDVIGTVKATGFSGDASGLTNVNAATVANGVYTTGSYANPVWITSLAGSKIAGDLSTGTIRLNNSELYLRSGTDTNHGLGWYGTGKQFAATSPDGPVLYGNSGGALGTISGGQKVLLKWDSGSFDFYGYARFRVLSGGSTQACLDANNSISTCSSDARMKKDVVTLSDRMDVIETLSRLRGVTFTWDTSNPKAVNTGGGQDLGMIAQEVETVFPEIVHTDKDGYKSLDYPKLVAFLIEVNKAQQVQLTGLQQMVEDMNKRLSAVEQR